MQNWVGMKTNIVFYVATICLLFFVICKEVFRMQGAGHSSNMLPSVVHSQIFRIITWKTNIDQTLCPTPGDVLQFFCRINTILLQCFTIQIIFEIGAKMRRDSISIAFHTVSKPNMYHILHKYCIFINQLMHILNV